MWLDYKEYISKRVTLAWTWQQNPLPPRPYPPHPHLLLIEHITFALVPYFMYIICPFYYSLDASSQFETLICSVSGFNIASMKEHGLQSFLSNLIHNQGWDRTMTTHLLYFTAKFLHGVYQCWYSYVWLPSCHGCIANSVFLQWSPLSLDMIRWWVTCCHMCSA